MNVVTKKQIKTWKPTTAGIISLIVGAFDVYYHTFGAATNHWHILNVIIPVILGLIALAGGFFAVRRQIWRLAVAGAVCTIYPPHPWGSLVWTPILGILGIVFLIQSRNEFSSN